MIKSTALLLFASLFCIIGIIIAPFVHFSNRLIQFQILCSTSYSVIHMSFTHGWKYSIFTMIYCIVAALIAELVAEKTQIVPFEHSKTALAPLLFDTVPLFIIMGWFSAIYQGFVTANWIIDGYCRVQPKDGSLFTTVMKSCIAGMITQSWDFAVDPFFAHYKFFWYKNTHLHQLLFGIPLINTVGWFVLSFVINMVVRTVHNKNWITVHQKHQPFWIVPVQLVFFFCCGFQFVFSTIGTTVDTRVVAFYTTMFPLIVTIARLYSVPNAIIKQE